MSEPVSVERMLRPKTPKPADQKPPTYQEWCHELATNLDHLTKSNPLIPVPISVPEWPENKPASTTKP